MSHTNISSKKHKSNATDKNIHKNTDKKVGKYNICENPLTMMVVLSVISAIFFDQTNRNESLLRMNILLVLVLTVCGYFICKYRRNCIKSSIDKRCEISSWLTTDRIIYLIIIAGFLFRIIYILYTDVGVRQNDIGNFVDNDGGHLGYIYYVYKNGHLPNVDPRTFWQYYQPPLHYVISAMWVEINIMFGASVSKAVEGIQILTLLYSGCFLYIVDKILIKLKACGRARIFVCTVLTTYPYFVMMAGAVNNDMLVTLMSTICIYYVVCWYYKQSIINIVLVGITFGLSMMSKMSGALLAPAIAFVFIAKLVLDIREKKINRASVFFQYIKQYVAFGVIAVPTALWFPIKNLIKYDLPVDYVPKIGDEAVQFIGQHGWLDRLFGFTTEQFTLFYHVWDTEIKGYTYNIFIALMKFGAFNEQNSGLDNNSTGRFLGFSLLFVMIIFTVLIWIMAIKWLISFKNSRDIKIFFIVAIGVIMISYVKFCMEFKHICTMNIRYVLIPLVLCMIAAGMFIDNMITARKRMTDEALKYSILFEKCLYVVTFLFVILSIISFRSMFM